MKLKVKCTLEVEIELPDDTGDHMFFMIEENSCPGTGVVGAAIDLAIEHAESNGVCWACNLRGKNKIIEVNGTKTE